MGQSLRRLQHIYRPVKNFNVEERAFKAISKDKPTPAPTHAKMKQIMDEIRQDPDLLTRGKFDPKTMENLSKVFITSEGHNTDMSVTMNQSTRKMPLDRAGHLEYEYGYEDPKVIPLGKTSMRQVLEILSNYELNPDMYSIEKIAQEYKLNENDVKNLVKFYKPFQVFMPKKPERIRDRNPLRRLQNKIDDVKK